MAGVEGVLSAGDAEAVDESAAAVRLGRALGHSDPSVRLQAALTAGTHPDPSYVEVLIARCGVEPDFSVRDMLTWAITRHPRALTVPRLVVEVASEAPQARSQSLHTLSKIADPSAWPVITDALLGDPDDEVARTAWRAAVALVPAGAERSLARSLAAQLGRGGREVQLSLSRALTALAAGGDRAGAAVSEELERAAARGDDVVAAHAMATERLLDDPDQGFESALYESRRTVALKGAPVPGRDDGHHGWDDGRHDRHDDHEEAP